jgi:hypothetical protein
MSFYTSRVVTRPEFSAGANVSPLLVLLRDSGSGSSGTRGWKSSTEKLALLSWLFVGGVSGGPTGGSAIGPSLAPARYTQQFLFRNSINEDFRRPQDQSPSDP